MIPLARRTLLKGAVATGLAGLAPRGIAGRTAPSDGDIAVRLLERYHPGLLRYQSASEWRQRADLFARTYDGHRYPPAQFVELARLLGAIRCSHTHINPANQSDAAIARHFAQGSRLLPFRFQWRGGRMIVTGDPHGTGLPVGQEIAEIDGGPVATILAAMLPMTRADGDLDHKRRALLSLEGSGEMETFDWLAAPLVNWRDTVTLGLGARGGRIERRRVPTITLAERRAAAPPPLPRDEATPWWTLARRGDVALLRMWSWAVFNTAWDWQGWLDARIDDLARDGTRALVIDLRGNEGGLTECGDRLLARLAATAVELPETRQLSRLGVVEDEDRPYLSTWDESIYAIGRDFPDAGNGLRRVPAPEARAIEPVGPRFAGSVAVLVGADNSSATGTFAHAVKANRLGLLVGQETGRNRRGGNGGAFLFATLPASGWSFDIPLIASHVEGHQPDRGTLPDVPVPLAATVRDDGVDVMLEAALRALGRSG